MPRPGGDRAAAGRLEQALEFYRCALDALDTQRRNLGGTDEVKARFGARYAAYYRETIDLLMEMGRPAEAFHVLERYRARGLLALLAERDLVFSADVPEELDRERRMANAEYDRALRGACGAAQGRRGRRSAGGPGRASGAARRRSRSGSARPRRGWPRCSTPSPWTWRRRARALDPGTLLLSYSIGEDKSHLFAVGPGPDDFLAVPLDADLATLRDEVASVPAAPAAGRAARGRGRSSARARRLSARAAGARWRERIARAERVLILPDGPLHLIPFAALGRSARPRAVPLSRRGPARPRRRLRHRVRRAQEEPRGRSGRRALVAFGDPDYSASPPARPTQSPSALRSAQERGLELRPLPGLAARRSRP